MLNKNIRSFIFILSGIIIIFVGINIKLFKFIPSVESMLRLVFFLSSIVFIIYGLFSIKTRYHRTLVNIIFLLPLIFAFVMTVILPFFLGFFYSMTDWNGISFSKFIGLQNYIRMFKSPDYIYSFKVTFIYSFFNILIVNLCAFSLALLCAGKLKGANFFRAAFFIPNLIGGIVLGYVWQFIFNKVLVAIFAGSDSMLSKPNTALAAIIIVSSWQYIGYIMMIYITGLMSIPSDVMEAANVDGASDFKALLFVKIPMMASSFTICIFLTLINSFKQFDLNYSITNGAPSKIVKGLAVPSTEFLSLNIYKTAIAKNDYGYGQAKAVVFFIILAIVALTQVYISKKREVEA